MDEGTPLSYRVNTKEKLNLNVLISQNGFFQTNQLTENLIEGEKYCDIQFKYQDLLHLKRCL